MRDGHWLPELHGVRKGAEQMRRVVRKRALQFLERQKEGLGNRLSDEARWMLRLRCRAPPDLLSEIEAQAFSEVEVDVGPYVPHSHFLAKRGVSALSFLYGRGRIKGRRRNFGGLVERPASSWPLYHPSWPDQALGEPPTAEIVFIRQASTQVEVQALKIGGLHCISERI